MIRCLRCRGRLVRLAPQRGLFEHLAGLFTVYPHRCQLCGHRFLRFRGGAAHVPRRNFTRVRVRFPAILRSAFYRKDIVPQRTTVVDLSIGGCRLDGPVQVSDGSRLRLDLTTVPEERPVVIDEAVVRSAPGQSVGLLFTQVRREERRRLARILRHRLRILDLEDQGAFPPRP